MLEKMILIDIETQDFNVEAGIYEVACLAIEEGRIVDQLYIGKEIKDWVGERKYGFGFHDISSDAQYVNIFKEFINKYTYPIVAHNCPFDRKFLTYYEWICHDYPCYCSMRAIRNSNNSLSSYALHNLVKHYNVSQEVTHTAMDDIMNVYKILSIVKPETWIAVGKNKPKSKSRSIDKVQVHGIESTNKIEGEIVCFTGTSAYSRVEMQEIARANGAEISDNITSKTTMLVVGLNAGSKLAKAQEKDIAIISDEEFMNLLNLKNVELEFRKIESAG